MAGKEETEMENKNLKYPLQIISKNIEKKEIIIWSTIYTLKDLRNHMEYYIDSSIDTTLYYIRKKNDNKGIPFNTMMDKLGMRRRTFEERMNDVHIGKLADII